MGQNLKFLVANFYYELRIKGYVFWDKGQTKIIDRKKIRDFRILLEKNKEYIRL